MDPARFPNDPELNPMQRLCISNVCGEGLSTGRRWLGRLPKVSTDVVSPQWDRDNAMPSRGIHRQAMSLVRGEYDVDHEADGDGGLGIVPAARTHPPVVRKGKMKERAEERRGAQRRQRQPVR
jgi:hypothetical protein